MVYAKMYKPFNHLTAKLLNLNFHPLKVVSRWRDPQLQVSENYSDLKTRIYAAPAVKGLRVNDHVNKPSIYNLHFSFLINTPHMFVWHYNRR